MKRFFTILLKHSILAYVTFMNLHVHAQSNPSAFDLTATNYSANFGTTTFTTLPASMAAWNGLDGDDITNQTLAESSVVTGNATIATATVATTTGGSFGFATASNGRYYTQTSGNATNGVNQLVLAVNTTNRTSIALSYDVEIISAQPRTVGVVCQYRVGTSGSWTTLTATSGSNPYSQAGGTTGVKSNVSITLPNAAANQAVVQIRWAIWRGTETGNSSGIAVDNVSVTSTVLPVEFQSIKANNTGNTNTLAWQVANEINIAGYQVERSSNNNNWETIGNVSANKAMAYTFEDKTPLSIAYYRVRSEELDGSKGQVTKVVSVQRTGKTSGLKVYPQPAANNATIELTNDRAGMTTLVLTDMAGRVVLQQNVATVEGLTQIALNTEGVAKGLYLLRISNGDWQETVKFVKQ
jgi:hypothetical protein